MTAPRLSEPVAATLLALLAAFACGKPARTTDQASPTPGAEDVADRGAEDGSASPLVEVVPPADAGPAVPAAADAALPPSTDAGRPGAPPKLLWKHRPDGYVGEADFREASLFSAEVVILAHHADSTGARAQTVTALDPAGGAKLWTAEEVEHVIHRAGQAAPLYLASRCWPDDEETDDCDSFRPVRELREIVPRTGEVTRRIAIEPLDSYGLTFHLAPGRILASRSNGLTAIDPASGATAWTARRPRSSSVRAPLVLADRAIADEDGCVAYALADGAELFRVPGCFGPVASPAGRLFCTRGGALESIAVGPLGETLATYPGRVVAASDRYAVFEDVHGPPDEPLGFVVYELDGGAAVLTLRGATRDEYYSAVTLYDGELFYYRSTDQTLWRHDVASDRRQRIRRFSAGFVIAPDGVGEAPAHLSDPPLLASPYLFINSWEIAAYRLAPLE